MHIHKRGHFSAIKKVGLVGLISSLGYASIVTIWAIYFETILKNPAYVGFLTSAFTIVGTLTYIFGVPFLQKSKKTRAYVLILSLMILSYFLFSIISNTYAIVLLGFVVSILGSLRISLYGIIVRDQTKDTEVSKNEGLIYTLLNISYLVAPILAGYLASEFGIKFIFLIASAMFLISLILVRFFKIKDERKTKKLDKKPFKTFISFFKNKDRVFAYVIGGGIDFWWVLIFIYVPIFLFSSGIGEGTIGLFLGATSLPLILTEYKFGKIVNKKGFKKIFISGYLILALAALICFFVTNIYVTMGLLILASFGAAMIEPTTEAYFFDVIKKRERDKFYSDYNTTININSTLARLLGAFILLILPFKFVFALFAIAMFTQVIISSKIKDFIECA